MFGVLKISSAIVVILCCNASVSFSAEGKITSLICVFEGSGKLSFDDTPRPVKIEQKIDFNDARVVDWRHHFISDYDYREHFAKFDGLTFGWLNFDTSVTEDTIKIISKMTDQKKLSTISNVEYNWYNVEMIISRKTGIGVRKVSNAFRINNDQFLNYEYHVSGDCAVRENKF